MSLVTKRRATQCVQREYFRSQAALPELRLAHLRQGRARMLSITRRRRVTVTVTRRRATVTVIQHPAMVMATVIGRGTDVRQVGQFKAETARRIRDRAGHTLRPDHVFGGNDLTGRLWPTFSLIRAGPNLPRPRALPLAHSGF